MADPIPQPPQDSDVPTGSDKFDVPPANYRMIGQMLAAGAADQKAAAGAGAKSGLDEFIAHPLDTFLKWVAEAVALGLSWFLCIIAFIMRLITAVDDGAAPGIAAVVKNSLGHVFGLHTGGTDRKVAKGVITDTMGSDIGDLIINALKAGVKDNTGQPIQPSDKGAKAFLAMLARLGIEGWVDGFVAEAIAGTHGAAILELVPIMNELLGLGRLSRRALTPLVKILVQDPYTARLHYDYRPAHLTEDGIVREYLRGNLVPPAGIGGPPPTPFPGATNEQQQKDALDWELGKLGHSPKNIQALVNLHTKGLGIGDIDFLVGHNFLSAEKAMSFLTDEGWKPEQARYRLDLPTQRRLDALDTERYEAHVAAYIRGDIDINTLNDALDASRLTAADKDFTRLLAIRKREITPKHLTLGQVETLIKAHIMSLDDLKLWMARENYPPEEELLLELWLMGEITTADEAKAAKKAKATAAGIAAGEKAAKAKADAEAAAAKLAVKGLTTATFEALVEAGLRSFPEYVAFLTQEGLPAASITALTDLLHHKITEKETAAAAHDAVLDKAIEKHIPLSQIEAAVLAGTIPIDNLRTFMEHQKFVADDVDVAVNYIQAKLDAATAKAAAAAAAAEAAKIKGVSLPNLERAARLGLTTPDDYAAALTAAGFDVHAVDLMTGILNAQIAADQATIAQRAAAAAKAAVRNISLPQLERAVINGLQPMGAYQAQLTMLGFEAGDVQTLVNLLQLQVDNAQDVAERKAAAAAKLGQKHLSLADIERAVKLHVLTMDQYRAELADIGFSVEDIGVLSASMLAELAITAAAIAKQTAVQDQLKNKGVSLAQEQQLVRAGLSSIDAYNAFLRSQGYADGVAAQLTQLLADQMGQAATAAAAHELAAARAAQKNISLTDEETAVVKGIRSMDDYAALLQDLGFIPLDQATLIALLELRMQPAEATAA
jgi:hypothetical protein